MKKLLLSLMVLAFVASCGKDNNVSTNGGIYTDPMSNTHITSGNNYYAYKALTDATMAINNHAVYFGTMYVTSSTGSNANCKEKWFGTWCTYSSKNAVNGGTTFNNYVTQYPNLAYIYSDGSYVVHSNVDIAAKKNELGSIFASATQISYVDYADGRIFTVFANGLSYQIDTRYPIQANPTRSNTRMLHSIQ